MNHIMYYIKCPFFATERNALVIENVCLDDGMYESMDNLRKCVGFMEYIMNECKDILTAL